jgi:hypothetical protein
LHDELNKTKIKDISGGKEMLDQLPKAADNLDGKGTLDVWVDMGTKLFRKVRIIDPENADSYIDLGLDYRGGDDYPFSFSLTNKENGKTNTASLKVTLNTNKDTISIDGDMNITSGSDKPVTGNLHLTAQPNNDKVDFNKPADAKSLTELLGQLFGGGVLGASTDQPSGDASQLPVFLQNL